MKKIRNANLSIMIIAFILGSNQILGINTTIKQNAWVTIIIAYFVFLPLAFVYISLIKAYPGKDLFEIVELLFGKFIGKIVQILYIWYAFLVGALVIRTFIDFVSIVAMQKTPQVVIMFGMAFLCGFVIKKGITVLTSITNLLVAIVISIVVLITLLSIPLFNFSYLKPVLDVPIMEIVNSSIRTFVYPFGETIMFLSFLNKTEKPEKVGQSFIIGVTIGTLFLLFTTLRNSLVLSGELTEMLVFPTYTVSSIINIYDFIQRIEITSAINFFITVFIKASVSLYTACLGLQHLFSLKSYKDISFPIAFLMGITAMILFESITALAAWTSEAHSIYASLFQIILPLLMIILLLFKKLSKKEKPIKLLK